MASSSSSSSSSSSKEPASHKFLVLFLGLLIGFVIGFVVLLSRLPVDDSLVNFKARETFRSPAANADAYKFYEVLPNQVDSTPTRAEIPQARPRIEVVERAPVDPTRNIPPATRPVPANAQILPNQYRVVEASYPKDKQSYFLQAGNFASIGEAQTMRAQVLRLGLQAFVIEREEPGGLVRHRVRVGPYKELGLLTEAKKRLRRGGISYEIVRVTG